MMVYYFVSTDNMDGVTISPRVPLRRMVREDNITARICVSQSVYGCLSAVGCFNLKDEVFVHKCSIEDDYMHQPTIDEVGDAYLSGELWCLVDIELSLHMKVQITDLLESKIGDDENIQYAFDILYSV